MFLQADSRSEMSSHKKITPLQHNKWPGLNNSNAIGKYWYNFNLFTHNGIKVGNLLIVEIGQITNTKLVWYTAIRIRLSPITFRSTNPGHTSFTTNWRIYAHVDVHEMLTSEDNQNPTLPHNFQINHIECIIAKAIQMHHGPFKTMQNNDAVLS